MACLSVLHTLCILNFILTRDKKGEYVYFCMLLHVYNIDSFEVFNYLTRFIGLGHCLSIFGEKWEKNVTRAVIYWVKCLPLHDKNV